MKDAGVKANHFNHLPDRNLNFDKDPEFERWSKTHETRALELVKDVSSLDDCEKLLSDRGNCDAKRAICSTSNEATVFTYSAFAFDTKNKVVRYAQGCPSEVGFREFSFEKPPTKKEANQVD